MCTMAEHLLKYFVSIATPSALPKKASAAYHQQQCLSHRCRSEALCTASKSPHQAPRWLQQVPLELPLLLNWTQIVRAAMFSSAMLTALQDDV